MRKLILFIVLFLPFVYIYSQDLDYYYIEFKEGQVPQNIQTTVNPDQTLALTKPQATQTITYWTLKKPL